MLTGPVAGCGWFQSGLQSGAPSFGGSDHLRLAKGCESSLVRFNSLCPWGLSPCWSHEFFGIQNGSCVKLGHAMLHGTSLGVVSETLASSSAGVSSSMRRF